MKIALVFLFVLFVSSGQSDPVRRRSPGFSANSRLELHVDRKLKGGSLEIVSIDGIHLMATKLRSRKVVIDFSEVQRGTYSISLRKGDFRNTFLFTKR